MNRRTKIIFFIFTSVFLITLIIKIGLKINLVNNNLELPMDKDEDMKIESRLPKTFPFGNSGKPSADQIKEKKLLSTSLSATLPNIVFIITDDQPPDTIGLSGNSVIKTPHIDDLGKRGVYFNNMYLTIGQCAPSRASIWTGKMPHSHGVIWNRIILPPDQITLPEILAYNGYNTAIIGKCHLGETKNPEMYKRGFDFRLITYPDVGWVRDWYDYKLSRNGALESHTEYITDLLTTETINYMKKQSHTGKPFFVWLAYTAPHWPTTPPKGSNNYDVTLIPTPKSTSDDLSTKPSQQKLSNPGRMFGKGWANNKQKVKKDFYEVISNIDDNVGRISDSLKKLGLADNTIVIYMTDNGYLLGEHQLFQKGPLFYEEQIKTPFIFSYPKLIKSAKITSALSSSLDILPTILEVLKIPIIDEFQGKSFFKILTGEISDYRDSIFLEYYCQLIENTNLKESDCPTFPMRGIVKDGYKLTHYLSSLLPGIAAFDGKDYELYNLKSDPNELFNIMKRLDQADDPLKRTLSDPQYGKILQNLLGEMTKWQINTHDPSKTIEASN